MNKDVVSSTVLGLLLHRPLVYFVEEKIWLGFGLVITMIIFGTLLIAWSDKK